MAGESKQIYQLTTKEFDGNVLVPFDTPNTDPSTQAQKPYVSGKASGDAVADFIANTEEYATDLDTEAKTITGAINELHAINGYSYDAYDDTATYAVGDLCIYNNTLYKCTTAITTAEAWNASHWTATSIADEISALNTGKQDNLSKGSLSSGDDLDNISTSGFYWSVAGVLNRPVSQYGVLEVCKVSSSIYLQRYTVSSSGTEDGSVYQRQHTSTGWKNWVKISV